MNVLNGLCAVITLLWVFGLCGMPLAAFLKLNKHLNMNIEI